MSHDGYVQPNVPQPQQCVPPGQFQTVHGFVPAPQAPTPCILTVNVPPTDHGKPKPLPSDPIPHIISITPPIKPTPDITSCGFSPNYQVQKQNWKLDIKNQGEDLFKNHAQGRQTISKEEAFSLVNTLTQQTHNPPAQAQDIYYLLAQIDDGNGQVDKSEFKLLLKILSGKKDVEDIQKKKNKKKQKNNH